MDNPNTATRSHRHRCCENRIQTPAARISYGTNTENSNLTTVTLRRRYIKRDDVDSIWKVCKLPTGYNQS